MERGLDVPEQSQGDAAEGVQPAPVDPGAADAPVEAAAPGPAEEAAAGAVAGAAADAAATDAAGVELAVPADTDAAAADAAVVEAVADDSAAKNETEADAEPVTAPIAAERAVDGSAEASVPDEPVPVSGPPRKRMLTGNVVSDKGDRTIVVSIARRKKHSLYKKYITLTRKLKAHDPDNECRVGDLVRVVESRPLSREKRWRLVEIVKRAG